jgi:type II secretory pathway predicted ATPase ExeA
MQYYQFYRLDGPPFQPASPNSDVYFSPTHLQGLATLEAGLSDELSGLTLLTGEAGTGKTTLIYSMLKRDYKRVRIAHIEDPKLSFVEILQSVLTQMNLYSAGSTKLDYLNTVDHLLKLHGEEERIAVVIDEAQLMSDDVLEELRLLSNRGQRSGQFLQLILVGQPELAERLKKPSLRQLNQRISSRGVLQPLNPEQANLYVECRLSAQGGSCSAIFEPRALSHLLRRSDGIPRKINMLCHTAMQEAFYGLEKKVSVRTAKKVAAEYHDSVKLTTSGFSMRRLAMPALIGCAAFAAPLLLGAFYMGLWSDWRLGHLISFSEVIGRVVPSAEAVTEVKTIQSPRVQGHSDSNATLEAVTSLASDSVESRSFPAPGAAPALPKSVGAGRIAAPEMPAVPVAPTAAAMDTDSHPSVEAAPVPRRRSQITIRPGDTLEQIAISYLGSTSGINELVKANPQVVNINRLSVGQVIYLPPGIGPDAAHDPTATARPLRNAQHSASR